jgi:hypothetical protein
MGLGSLVDAVKAANVNSLILSLKDGGRRASVLSRSATFDDLMGRGLPRRNPVSYVYPLSYVYKDGWASRSDGHVGLPVALDSSAATGSMSSSSWRPSPAVLRPKRVFEIGTFNGRATSVFILNAPGDAKITSLDLPPDADPDAFGYLPSDAELVGQRRVASVPHQLRLTHRYEQLLCDSRQFDPTPYAGTIELGFIDGAHALEYVDNDTRKMAVMMAERGVVFWHDYGGKGRFRELTQYLDRLVQRLDVFRVAGMTLAWSPASELHKLR